MAYAYTILTACKHHARGLLNMRIDSVAFINGHIYIHSYVRTYVLVQSTFINQDRAHNMMPTQPSLLIPPASIMASKVSDRISMILIRSVLLVVAKES